MGWGQGESQSSVRTTYAVPGSVPGISLLPMKPSRKPLLG